MGGQGPGAGPAPSDPEAYPSSGLDAVFPLDVYSGEGKEVAQRLTDRYQGWLDYRVEAARDLRSFKVTLRNRGPAPHTLRLGRPDWKTAAERAPRYVMVWVGGRETDSFSSEGGGKEDKVLAPGQSWELTVPANLSREKLRASLNLFPSRSLAA